MSGPLPISYSEIRVWLEVTGEIIRRDEIAILRRMDDAYLEAIAAEYAAQRERREEQNKTKK